MITAVIVDDEPLAVNRLARLLGKTGRVHLVGSTTDPVAAIDLVAGWAPDVLFLDIEMPEINGFELLQRLAAVPLVVFTTAFDHYALAAFDANSVDYLLKPIEAERLDRALDRVERLRGHERPDLRVLVRDLAAQLAPPKRLERIASRIGERTLLLDVSRISHFVARDKLTFATIAGREHVVDETLTQLEAVLDPDRFVRIHRTTIVNLAAVSELDRWIDGGMLVRLRDERKTELPVARDRVRILKERLRIS
jgi:two-component system, LytTR family, response regulator